jgi:CheY-like chemotaxis protein
MAPIAGETSALDPICTHCSKPILPGTGTQDGRLLHVRCLAEEKQNKTIEEEDRASREQARAFGLTQRARDLVEQSRRARQSTCSVCARPLADGGSLLFQGSSLVHALCWRVDGDRRAGIQASAPVPNDLDARPFTGARILVIEDHEDSRDALRLMLEQAGATVYAAANGGDGLAIAEHEPPHLVLCDLRMPGMDGFALLAALRALSNSNPIRVVAVTGLGGEDELERTRVAGFDGHLVKPVDYDLLVKTLRPALGLPT